MICPPCRFDAPAEFTFCPKCGARLQRTCPQCGQQVPAEFGFCPRCGTAVDAAPAEARQQQASAAFQEAARKLMPQELANRLMANRGQVSNERRQVTILFCDIKGFTALAENLDPEDMLEIINGAFEFLMSSTDE